MWEYVVAMSWWLEWSGGKAVSGDGAVCIVHLVHYAFAGAMIAACIGVEYAANVLCANIHNATRSQRGDGVQQVSHIIGIMWQATRGGDLVIVNHYMIKGNEAPILHAITYLPHMVRLLHALHFPISQLQRQLIRIF